MRSSSPGILFLGILAVLFGLIGAYGAKKYLEQPQVPPPPTPVAETTITVPLAIRDLPEGRSIALGDFTTVRLTEQQVRDMNLPEGFMTRSSQIIGRTLRSAVLKSQAFQPEAFLPDGIGPNIASRLGRGERAVSIRCDDSASQAGLITPGAMVDVLFRTTADAAQMLPEATMTLLDNVQVLAVDRETEDGATPMNANGQPSGRTVTLAVTPLQARALQVVEDRGTLSLVLRGGSEDRLVSTVTSESDPQPESEPLPEAAGEEPPADVDELLSVAEADASSSNQAPLTLAQLLGIREAGQPQKMEIYRRGQRTTVIYGTEGRTVIQETPYGMPIAEQPRALQVQGVSQHVPATPAPRDSAAADKKSCGCGATAGTTSALLGQRVARASGL